MAKRQARGEVHDDAPTALADVDFTTDPKFIAYVEAHGGLGLDPLSDEALRFQAQYIKHVGAHPLDVLKQLSLNVFVKPGDRISAAKALLEYGARKVPAQLELTGKNGEALKLDHAQLTKLSDKELATLEALLSKVEGSSA